MIVTVSKSYDITCAGKNSFSFHIGSPLENGVWCVLFPIEPVIARAYTKILASALKSVLDKSVQPYILTTKTPLLEKDAQSMFRNVLKYVS